MGILPSGIARTTTTSSAAAAAQPMKLLLALAVDARNLAGEAVKGRLEGGACGGGDEREE